MASINFTQFNLKTPLCATDFLVGIRADNTEEIKTTVKDVLNLYDLGQVITLSTNWNNTYTNVSQNSGYWNSRSDVVNANAENWNTAFNSVPLTNSSYTTLNANSANWNESYIVSVDFISVYTTTKNNSANWNVAFVASPKAFSVYTSVTANSGNWNAAFSIYTSVTANSGNWDAAYTTTRNNSANWNTAFSVVPNSNSAYTTTRNNSANWNTAFSVVPRVNSNYTTTNSNSANWNLAHKISTDYRNISSSYTTKSYTDSKFLPLTGGIMTGDLSIFGNLSASGVARFFETENVTISTIFVENYGTGPALTVNQYGTEPVARFYDEGNIVFAIEDSDKVIVGGLEASDQMLTVHGGISATENIYASNLYTTTLCAENVYGENINYEEWDSVFTTVTETSGSWDYQGTDIKDLTANWQNTYQGLSTYLPLTGGNITQDLNVQGRYLSAGVSFFDIFTGRVDVNNVVIGSSSRWDSTYTTLCANSGTWNKAVLSDVALESSTAGLSTVKNIVALTEEAFASLSEKNPSTLYVIVSSTSANFLTVSLFQDSSGNWESTYTTVKENSATTWNYQGTDIKEISGIWQSTYTTVKGNSATTWNYQGTDIKNISGIWESTYTTVKENSAAWIIDITVDTEVRDLTSNWQSTYTTFQNNSTNYSSTHTTFKENSTNYSSTYTSFKQSSGNYDSTYTTLYTNSASWNYQGSDLKELSSNWESTYTTVQENSGNYNSTYTTVQDNSAFWATDSTADTEVRELTSNWESTYTTVNENSADWLPFSIYNVLTSEEITDFSESDIWILSALPMVFPKAGSYEYKITILIGSLSGRLLFNTSVIQGISCNNLVNFQNISNNIFGRSNFTDTAFTPIANQIEDKLVLPWRGQVRNDNDPENINTSSTIQGFIMVDQPTTFYFYISSALSFTKPSVSKSFYMLNYKPNATFNAF